jgi:hypothetical protein
MQQKRDLRSEPTNLTEGGCEHSQSVVDPHTPWVLTSLCGETKENEDEAGRVETKRRPAEQTMVSSLRSDGFGGIKDP